MIFSLAIAVFLLALCMCIKSLLGTNSTAIANESHLGKTIIDSSYESSKKKNIPFCYITAGILSWRVVKWTLVKSHAFVDNIHYYYIIICGIISVNVQSSYLLDNWIISLDIGEVMPLFLDRH